MLTLPLVKHIPQTAVKIHSEFPLSPQSSRDIPNIFLTSA